MSHTHTNVTHAKTAGPTADRVHQLELLAALGIWDRALRRDACGAWVIIGKQGSIHTWGDGQTWVLWVTSRSVRHWTATKARLSFCSVVVDGDDEGMLRLHHLPTPSKPRSSATRWVSGSVRNSAPRSWIVAGP